MSTFISPERNNPVVFDVEDSPELAKQIIKRLEELGFSDSYLSIPSLEGIKNIAIGLDRDHSYVLGYCASDSAMFDEFCEIWLEDLFDMQEPVQQHTLVMYPYSRKITQEHAQGMLEGMDRVQAMLHFEDDQDAVLCENMDEIMQVRAQLKRIA